METLDWRLLKAVQEISERIIKEINFFEKNTRTMAQFVPRFLSIMAYALDPKEPGELDADLDMDSPTWISKLKRELALVLFSYYFGEGRIKKRFEEYHILAHFLWMENSQSSIILQPLRDMVMNSKSLLHEEKSKFKDLVLHEQIQWVESAKNTCSTLDAALFPKTDDEELTEVLDEVELNYGLPDDSQSQTNGDTIQDEIHKYQNFGRVRWAKCMFSFNKINCIIFLFQGKINCQMNYRLTNKDYNFLKTTNQHFRVFIKYLLWYKIKNYESYYNIYI